MKKLINSIFLLSVKLNLFAGNTNVTGDTGLSDEMKTFYSDYLIDLAEPELVHDQFAQKHPIPKNGGKNIEFRKYDSLPKLTTTINEGITPDGQKLSMGVITATVNQYGGFIEMSDMLLMTAIDNNLVEATKLLASQAGRTLDTITREVLNGGGNVRYAKGVSDRSLLVGGDATAANNCYLTVDDVKKAARDLKVQNAPKINGDYVAIIHPDVAYDLMSDPEWKYPHQYVDTANIYNGEIGKVAGVRFVESTEAKIFYAPDLTEDDGADVGRRTLTVSAVASKVITITQKLTANQATALAGRKLIIAGKVYTVDSASAGAAGAATISIVETPGSGVAASAVIYPGEAGAAGRSVYSTLFMGANAYGVTEISGGGLQHIVKQLGSAGTADPLDQRATAGWKATKVAERLVEQYIVRVESASTFDDAHAN